jgi:methyltransferase
MGDPQSAGLAVAALTLLAVLLMMGGEALLSSYNAAVLRARGAVEPADDVIATMQWAYPLAFVAMAVEGALTGPPPGPVVVAGLAVFGLAKALKIWAIATLGWRWTFRVLVPPGAPLVAAGPYRVMRHPNYLAVVGELVGVALTVGAPLTGVLGVLGFGALLRRRIAVEDRALRPTAATAPGRDRSTARLS